VISYVEDARQSHQKMLLKFMSLQISRNCSYRTDSVAWKRASSSSQSAFTGPLKFSILDLNQDHTDSNVYMFKNPIKNGFSVSHFLSFSCCSYTCETITFSYCPLVFRLYVCLLLLFLLLLMFFFFFWQLANQFEVHFRHLLGWSVKP